LNGGKFIIHNGSGSGSKGRLAITFALTALTLVIYFNKATSGSTNFGHFPAALAVAAEQLQLPHY